MNLVLIVMVPALAAAPIMAKGGRGGGRSGGHGGGHHSHSSGHSSSHSSGHSGGHSSGKSTHAAKGATSSGGSHSTRGYTKRDGTYVAPSGAKNPNGNTADNYSTKGNTNTYSGKAGTKTNAGTVPSRVYLAPALNIDNRQPARSTSTAPMTATDRTTAPISAAQPEAAHGNNPRSRPPRPKRGRLHAAPMARQRNPRIAPLHAARGAA